MTSTDTPSPNGGAWAAVLGATIGCAFFGVATDLAEMSKPISKALAFYLPTGDLSGKSTAGVLVWLLAWGILHARWKTQTIRRPVGVMLLSLLLLLVGMVLILPPFVDLITGH